MDILTFIGCCISLTILWESGILGIFIFACIVVFVWEKCSEIIIIILLLSGLVLLLKYVLQGFGFQNYEKENKPKTDKETELEENLNKVREWSRRNKC